MEPGVPAMAGAWVQAARHPPPTPLSLAQPRVPRPSPQGPARGGGWAALTRPLREPVSWSRELGTAAWGRPQWHLPLAEGE